jgi:acetolactate decarboxylase
MHSLSCRLPASLWHALEARRRDSGQSTDHIVRAALADYLQVDHSTLFQISSSSALVEGI